MAGLRRTWEGPSGSIEADDKVTLCPLKPLIEFVMTDRNNDWLTMGTDVRVFNTLQIFDQLIDLFLPQEIASPDGTTTSHRGKESLPFVLELSQSR